MAKTKGNKSAATSAPKAKSNAKTASVTAAAGQTPATAKTGAKPTAAKKKNGNGSTHPGAAFAPTHDQIAAKAYEIWVAKGQPLGQDAANWAEAEAALRS